MARCAHSECAPAPDAGPPRLAALHSDYTGSSSISLLDASGRIASADWLSGATLPVGLAPVLGSDVVFPSEQRYQGRLTFIDRLGLDRITAVEIGVPTQNVVSFSTVGVTQSSQHRNATYRPNPQDAFRLSDGTWLVTRPEPKRGSASGDPGAAEGPSSAGDGDDIVRLDPASGDLLGRLDLSTLRDDGLWARPARFAPLGGSLLAVGLWHLSGDYQVAGPGRIALMDYARWALVQNVDLTPFANCGEVAAYADTLFVLCRGTPFATPDQRQGSSGIVQLTWAEGRLGERRRFHPRVPTEAPSLGLLPLSRDRVLFVAEGDFLTDESDALFVYDFSSDTATRIYQARAAFVLGAPVGDGETLYLPLADAGLVVLPTAASSQEIRNALPTTCRKLPLRALSWLLD